MNYLYHRVPDNIKGAVLYPLNTLKNIYPDIYNKEASKYNGREHVIENIIPIFNCKWNDVLHLSAVNPSDIKDALRESGYMTEFSLSCYKIDPNILNTEETIVYLSKPEFKSNPMVPENFTVYNPKKVEEYSFIPDGTKEYYRRQVNEGKVPLLFPGIVHILYKGNINIESLDVVTVK